IWTAESYDRAQIGALKYKAQEADWQVSADGKSVTQPMDAQPTFFYSDFESLGSKISLKMEVESATDDDFIGFALNFKPGDTNNKNADFLLLNWNAQAKRAGLKLSRVQGIPSFLDILYLPQVAKAKTLSTKGWENNKLYQLEVAYSKNKLQIWVDGSLEFDLDGEFENGRFACFDCSQKEVFFSEIEAKLEGSSWEKPSQTKLQPTDLQGKDCFGYSVAISGEVAIVGTPYADAPGKTDAGAAYIFQFKEGTWQQQQKLQPTDLQRKDWFGYSVAISGEVAIVGAVYTDAPGKTNAGAAYIFELEGETWKQQQKLQPDDLQRSDYFGQSVAISGEVAIIGTPYTDTPGQSDAGAAYIFELEGKTWQQQQKLQPTDLQRSDRFGRSVAISGEVAIVGANLADAPGQPDAGAAYIFQLKEGTWQQQQKLQPTDLQRSDRFGISVAISEEVAIVGANLADASGKPDAGAAYIFELEGGTWKQQKLQPADLQRDDSFGISVAISGEVAIVGAFQADAPAPSTVSVGAAYIFQLEGGTWKQQKLQPTDLQRSDRFGRSVAISGEVAFVGALNTDAPSQPDAGAAYIFQAED
ncbi:MAG: hypothetical protein F6K41_40050, partial [Symploca sp. SIO3E6]|nr:hypothetical protein [Caldora sp. SIO3E6]